MSPSPPRLRETLACRRLSCARHCGYGGMPSATCRRKPTTPRSIGISSENLSGVPRRLAEKLLHLAAHLHGGRVRIHGDVAPPDGLPGGDRPQHLPPVREPERQAALRERVGSGHQAADDGVAAFAVEYLCGL